MPSIELRPNTPGQRFHVRNKQNLAKKRPVKVLTRAKLRTGGRNCYGRITSRRRGGGHKRLYRQIDFKREKLDIPATVRSIEYDPNRTANIALMVYADGAKRYILAPTGINEGDVLVSTRSVGTVGFTAGNNMPLKDIPPATKVHAIELHPLRGAQLARSAGTAAHLVGVDGKRATLRMPSGELRLVHSDCTATIGEVGNAGYRTANIGKAGRNRWKGRRPRVRGVAMNPVDHPMGGGEGRTSGGGHPMSPWGQLSKNFPTRPKKKHSNKLILIRRDGRKMKK